MCLLRKIEKHNKKIEHKNPCRIRDLNPGHLASTSNALPLHHRVKIESNNCSQAI